MHEDVSKAYRDMTKHVSFLATPLYSGPPQTSFYDCYSEVSL